MQRGQFFTGIAVLMVLVACKTGGSHNQSKVASADSLPFIKFDSLMISIGSILSGEKAGIDFVYTNTGGQELEVLEARVSCGCTVPEWKKEKVGPGQKGNIRVIYDSSGELGMQNKSIRIISNARNREVDLIISAEVIN